MITKIEITNLKHEYGCDCCIMSLVKTNEKLEGYKGYLAAYCIITLDNCVWLENCKIYEFFPSGRFNYKSESKGCLLQFNDSIRSYCAYEIEKRRSLNFIEEILRDFCKNREKYYAEVIKEFLLTQNRTIEEDFTYLYINTIDNSDEHRNQNQT